jgi:ubiquinone/menaquinone biosynthesis C-methylase UbiE
VFIFDEAVERAERMANSSFILKNIIDFYTNNYDEDTRLVRHPTEFVATTFILNKFVTPGLRILDLGAGTGIYSLYYAGKGCSVIALDIVPRHVEILNSRLKDLKKLDISTEVGDAQDLSRFRTGSFDLVLCMGPFYHLPETGRCISECLRVLSSQGILAVSYSHKNVSGELDKRYRELFLSHTMQEIDQLFRACNLERIRNVPTDGEPLVDLEKVISDHPGELDKAHSWLESHESVFEQSDKIFLHGLYVGRKSRGKSKGRSISVNHTVK